MTGANAGQPHLKFPFRIGAADTGENGAGYRAEIHGNIAGAHIHLTGGGDDGDGAGIQRGGQNRPPGPGAVGVVAGVLPRYQCSRPGLFGDLDDLHPEVPFTEIQVGVAERAQLMGIDHGLAQPFDTPGKPDADALNISGINLRIIGTRIANQSLTNHVARSPGAVGKVTDRKDRKFLHGQHRSHRHIGRQSHLPHGHLDVLRHDMRANVTRSPAQGRQQSRHQYQCHSPRGREQKFIHNGPPDDGRRGPRLRPRRTPARDSRCHSSDPLPRPT